MLQDIDARKGVPALAPKQSLVALEPPAGPLLQSARWDHILSLGLLVTLPLSADLISMSLCVRAWQVFVLHCSPALQ